MVFVRKEIPAGYQANHLVGEITFDDLILLGEDKYFPVCGRYAEVMRNGHFTSRIEHPVEEGKQDHRVCIEIPFIMKIQNAVYTKFIKIFQIPSDIRQYCPYPLLIVLDIVFPGILHLYFHRMEAVSSDKRIYIDIFTTGLCFDPVEPERIFTKDHATLT